MPRIQRAGETVTGIDLALQAGEDAGQKLRGAVVVGELVAAMGLHRGSHGPPR